MLIYLGLKGSKEGEVRENYIKELFEICNSERILLR